MPPQDPQLAVRLIFEYDGDDVRLVSEQPVEMIVPDQESPLDIAAARAAGVFVDARDEGNVTLARVRAPAAFESSVEVYPERPTDPFVRLDVPRPSGAFTVVVPAPASASRVALVRVAEPPPGPLGAAPPARETEASRLTRVSDIASFPLRRR
jgi:hypothetical protein